jgi:hypothetical protein
MTPGPPPHRLSALTTYELTRYRRDLEHALTSAPAAAQVRSVLRARLADVLAEQEARTRLRDTSGR